MEREPLVQGPSHPTDQGTHFLLPTATSFQSENPSNYKERLQPVSHLSADLEFSTKN